MKTVRLRYFAVLRDQRGLGSERVETAAATAAAPVDPMGGE